MNSRSSVTPDAESQNSELRTHNLGGWRPSEFAFNLTVLLLYVAVLLVVGFHHERWRDEAEAWLFARDAGYTTIVSRAGYAGHTAPWFLLLAVFAKSGAPYASIAFLNGLFATGAIGLFMWKAPFARVTRVLFVFSFYPLFEYGVVARHYALTMLLIFVVATLFPRRAANPILYAAAVFVLSNLNVQGVFIGFALALAFFAERIRTREWNNGGVAGMIVMGSGLLLAALQLRPPPDAAIAGFIRMFEPSAIQIALADAFFPVVGRGAVWAAILGGAIVLVAGAQIRRLLTPSIVLWMPLVLFAYLWVFKWPGSARHHGFVLLVVIFVLWLARSEGPRIRASLDRAVEVLLAATLLCSMIAALHQARLDVLLPFSGAKDTASFLETSGLTGLPIAGHSAPRTAAVLPYLPGRKQIWFAGIGDYGSYLTWDHQFNLAQLMSYPEAVARARRHFGAQPWLLLLDAEMPDPKEKGFELLFRSPERIVGYPDETFYLYRPLKIQ